MKQQKVMFYNMTLTVLYVTFEFDITKCHSIAIGRPKTVLNFFRFRVE